MSIKVAIRVRPFTPREIKLRTDLCVSMSGNSCTLRSEDGKERSFAFDHCFWSHDGFREEKDGKFVSTSDKYADQNAVFDKVGKEILENAWAGYHCCLFAYGQTGSGKSYSIIGYGSNQGIVPRTAEEIFKRINQTKSPNKIYEVTTSMMEIYNEKIHDLLVAGSYQKEGGLKVRENKTLGVYVEDLSKWPVQSFADISSKIEEGNRNRTIASTALNSTSSRAHTIITIELRQVDKTTDKAVSRHSVIYLVDLAGSERVGKSDTKGDRLKETCSINKSLSALGKVISTLAERDSTKKSNVVIPYRDAVLTRILQNALGGNSKTLMICAISPAMENYDETLSTLRYADQAKKIKCNAVVNESETDKIIRLLKEENEKLRLQLLGTNSSGGANQVNKELEEQLQANQHLIDGLMKPFEQRIKEMKELINTDQVYDYSAPHLININEDMLLSGKIFFNLLAIPILYVGRKNSKPKPHVILNGPGIEAKHARIMNNDGRIFIVPQSPECKHIFVNGKIYPGHEHESALVNVDEKSLDWEFYMAELTRENEGLFGQTNTSVTNEDEMTKMKTNFEVQYEKAKKDIEQKMHAQREEYEKKLKSLQTEKVEHEWTEENFEEFLREYQRENAQQEVEFERERKRIFDMEKVIKRRKVIVKKLQKKLLKVASMVSELNLMSAELNRKVKFFLDLGPGYLEDDSVLFAITDIIRVKVINEEYNLLYYWGLNKLNDRYFLIRDVLDEFFDTDQLPQVENDKDPFWDPEEPIDVGRCFLSFKPLSLLFDTEKTLRIYKETETVGTIHVKICPCSKAGDPLDEEEVQDYTDPMQLLGTNVHFYIEITKANINPFYTKQCYFQYRLNHDDFAEKIFKTERLQSESGVMDFAFKETHTLNKLDESGLIFLTESKLELMFFSKISYQESLAAEELSTEPEATEEASSVEPMPSQN